MVDSAEEALVSAKLKCCCHGWMDLNAYIMHMCASSSEGDRFRSRLFALDAVAVILSLSLSLSFCTFPEASSKVKRLINWSNWDLPNLDETICLHKLE